MPPATCHILLIENEPSHVKLASRGIQAAGDRFALTVATSLNDGQQSLQDKTFDLIMVDLVLPDGLGTELLAMADCPPLIVLTSHGDEQSAVQALKAGALDYVVKSEAVLIDLPHVADRALREWEHIVARRSAEAALRKSEARFRSIFEHEPECVSLHDARGRVLDMNPAGLQMFDAKSLQEMQQREFTDMLDPQDAEEFHEALAAVFRGETCQWEFKTRRLHGTRLQLDANLVPLRSSRGHVEQVLVVTRDITLRRAAEERSQDLWLQLAHVNRLSSLGEMASAIAHEVNQPLGAIANYAGTCASLIANDRWEISNVERCLQKINEQALRAGAILARLKSFVAKTSPQPVQLDLNVLIREVLQLLKVDMQNAAVQVHLAIDEEIASITGDSIQIQQVLVNLLRNALEAMGPVAPEKRQVSIVSRNQAEGVRVSVADTGTGIANSRLGSIFEPYETTKSDGLGMGLSISRSIINAHGGRLWAENNQSGGATLYFELPIKNAAPR